MAEFVVSQQCSQAPQMVADVRPGYPTQESVQEDEDEDVSVPMDTSSPHRHPTQESSTVLRDRIVPSIGTGMSPSSPISEESRYGYLTSYTREQMMPEYNALVNDSDILCYDINSPVGYAALFCNDQLLLDNEKLPVFKDLELMSKTLHSCDWRVQTFPPNSSMNLDQCNERLHSIAGGNYNGYSCFMFYYSGHGNSQGLLLSDDSCMPYNHIISRISSNNSLDEKPKIFVFDSCRGLPSKSKGKHGGWPNFFHKDKVEIQAHAINIPNDALVCFSTNEGTKSFAGDNIGSFFTSRLTKMLKKFWRKLTFTEIVTLAQGCTAKLAQNVKKQQQPVMECSLRRLLLLDTYVFHGKKTKKPRSPLAPGNSELVLNTTITAKGPECQEKPDEFASDVETDAVGKRLVFKTKDDVTKNLHRLGQGVSVFVCYTPDPESPYHNPKDRETIIAHNQMQIVDLIHDLERCGFTVISDLHLGTTQPRNLLQWYVSRIELCDYLVMVCSPALKELFSCVEVKGEILDERSSWFRTYCDSIYAEIHKEGKKSAVCSKFIPVILNNVKSSEDDCVPSLLAAGSKYRLYQDSPRKFDFDVNAEWEQLVCRMAGIDRNKLSAPTDQGVVKLAPPYSRESLPVNVPKKVLPRRGHKAVPWVPPPSNEPPLEPSAPKRVQHDPQAPPNPLPSVLPQAAEITPPPPTVKQYPQSLELPDEPPANSVILWLCDKITDWKFFARYLDMDNSEIEKIAADHRDSVREQRYHMFESWKRHEWSEYTYRTLGKVLLKSDSNKLLYGDFCREIVHTEQS